MFQWFFRFSEFTEFNESSASFRESLIVTLINHMDTNEINVHIKDSITSNIL